MAHDQISDHENLGRACFDSGEAGRKRPRHRFISKSFIDGKMSVDRLDDADYQRLTQIHTNEGQYRNPSRTFHGWYTFPASNVLSMGWEVQSDPTPTNPWHAEVDCGSLEDNDAHRQRCVDLASQACWEPAR